MTRRQSTRPGYTLIELVVTMGASAILMGGLASTLYMSSQALAPDASASDEDNRSSLALAQVTADLRLALSFSERTAQAVTFTVPDRNSDAQVETIRYSWTGVAGAPLLFQYNGNAAVSIADDVQRFNLSELNREIPMTALGQASMSVEFHSYAEARTSGNSLGIPQPLDVGEGDLMIAAVAIDGDSGAALNGASGWTLVATQNHGTTLRLAVWRKIASNSEPSTYNFSWSNNRQAYGWIMRFSGADPDFSPSAVANTGTSSTPQCLAGTSTVANSLVLRVAAFKDDAITVDNPNMGGHETITMDASAQTLLDLGPSASGGAAHRTLPMAGTTGTATFGLTGLTPSKAFVTMTIVIPPDGV